ncbi:MAG TPA: NAD(P)-binding domain-containing protein [Rhodopila sp.]|nr:NAD(P)-binding domain-containing protein [Rhodopila sp.]
MGTVTDVAIIGAGPYGLSLGAHLAAAGLNIRVFGQPMHTWRNRMPEGMVLKSEGFASNLWHPEGAFTLKDYCEQHGLPYQDTGLPVPLATFCDYGVAFQRRFVPMLDDRWVVNLERTKDCFALRLEDDEVVTSRRVVIAAGIASFSHIPPELDAIRGPICSHSIEHHFLERFAGQRVLIIGGGASGVGLAALMSPKGANVSVAARRSYIPYCDPPRPRSLLERIQEPETGLGYGWRSLACVYAPMLFYSMPRDFRHLVVRKHLGPAPGWTSREVVERDVNVILGAKLAGSRRVGDKAHVTLHMDSGGDTVVEADHVVSATGFKVDMRRLRFLSPGILEKLRCADHTPELSTHFETSVPGLFVIGTAAANNFGPLMRFAYGAGFASRRLSSYLVRTAARRKLSAEPELVAA